MRFICGKFSQGDEAPADLVTTASSNGYDFSHAEAFYTDLGHLTWVFDQNIFGTADEQRHTGYIFYQTHDTTHKRFSTITIDDVNTFSLYLWDENGVACQALSEFEIMIILADEIIIEGSSTSSYR